MQYNLYSYIFVTWEYVKKKTKSNTSLPQSLNAINICWVTNFKKYNDKGCNARAEKEDMGNVCLMHFIYTTPIDSQPTIRGKYCYNVLQKLICSSHKLETEKAKHILGEELCKYQMVMFPLYILSSYITGE